MFGKITAIFRPLALQIITKTYQTMISSNNVADWILNLNFIGNNQGLEIT